jgi:predicted secreted hydrolase
MDHSLRRSKLAFSTWLFLFGYLFTGIPAWSQSPTPVPSNWTLALPGWNYEFPRDHGSHPDFKTEWWYFTGNLATKDGREFGYQLTFFRQGIQRELPADTESRFAVRDLWFAHFAVADLSRQTYRHFHRWSRGAFSEAGARIAGKPSPASSRWLWIDHWTAQQTADGPWLLEAHEENIAISLELRPLKPPIFHGENGVSQKAAGPGRASHYYSFTRLATIGTIEIDGQHFPVEGLSWYDHEWATNQLTEKQEGWDWFSLQFADGTELMLFQIRQKDGGRDPFSGGTWIDAAGNSRIIRDEDFRLIPLQHWSSPTTKGRYPISWQLEIPPLDLQLAISTPLAQQEFNQPPIYYWEGAIRANGRRGGQPLQGRGYLEMTGYGSPIVGMQATENAP